MATGTSGCGDCAPASPTQKRISVAKGKPLGKRWHAIFGDELMKDAAKVARERVRTGEQVTDDGLTVQIPALIFVHFPRKGKSIAKDGGVRCACTFPQKGVCKCIGQCSDNCCDLIVV
jgi:hypothetical protein